MTTDSIEQAEAKVADLRRRLAEAQRARQDALDALGAATARGDEKAAGGARGELAAARAAVEELEAAIPYAERAVEAARAAQDEARRRAARDKATALASSYVKAAERIDNALTELGVALDEHEAIRPHLSAALREAGDTAKADALARRAGPALARALWAQAPLMARAIHLDRHGRREHETPLATCERRTLGDNEVADAEER